MNKPIYRLATPEEQAKGATYVRTATGALMTGGGHEIRTGEPPVPDDFDITDEHTAEDE